ncbi:Putative aminoacrylate hydrolase RutD [Methylobacterium soli]|nr:Putative aminoacrylate hydrolase RutD [Methylobacterium soli]
MPASQRAGRPLASEPAHRAGSGNVLPPRPSLHSTAVAGILGLSATALVVRAWARRAERANPPRGRFVAIDGVRLHYVARGRGEPLVVFHGNGCLAEEVILSGFVALAAERFRVIVFDRPGYGHSTRPRRRVWTPAAQADLLIGALERIGVTRSLVLGHSWGALVAIAAALRHPDAVRGLILEGGYYYPCPRADAVLFSGLALPVLGDALRHTAAPILARLLWPAMLRRLFSPAGIAPSFARFPTSMALRPSQLRASADESGLMIPGAMILRRHYAELGMPVAIIAGAGDRMVDPAAQSGRLHGEIRQSSLRLVEHCGHMVHHTAPRPVMAALDEVARSARLSRTSEASFRSNPRESVDFAASQR